MYQQLNQQLAHRLSQINQAGRQHSLGSRMRDYETLSKLGQGAYGVVYKVRSRLTKEVYVIKRIDLVQMKAKDRHKTVKEVEIMQLLDHPHIIKYHHSFLEDNAIAIVMEYVDGGDLAQLIHKLKASRKYIGEQELMVLMKGLLSALEFLHSKRVLHRDIKTPNILITKSGVVKLGDMGVSKILQQGEQQQTRVGTPLYLAPEQVLNQPYDYKIDIWALGCVFYYLAVHRPPFYGDNLLALGNDICKAVPKVAMRHYSSKIQDIILQMMNKSPRSRPDAKSILQQFFPPALPKHYKSVNETGIKLKVDNKLNKELLQGKNKKESKTHIIKQTDKQVVQQNYFQQSQVSSHQQSLLQLASQQHFSSQQHLQSDKLINESPQDQVTPTPPPVVMPSPPKTKKTAPLIKDEMQMIKAKSIKEEQAEEEIEEPPKQKRNEKVPNRKRPISSLTIDNRLPRPQSAMTNHFRSCRQEENIKSQKIGGPSLQHSGNYLYQSRQSEDSIRVAENRPIQEPETDTLRERTPTRRDRPQTAQAEKAVRQKEEQRLFTRKFTMADYKRVAKQNQRA